ncbi:hypothetical protein NLX86_10370 [Streptomyces sp. A3M-1-3]|uniref:hypothetical protein n=1 Tax=Streptomyces sp. A3M-1-3 TaxID=2962044 RepID=UPI0020B67817|nr:hypothetical protein [Streptomyces sp. A3M-1-3]MCP3818507.1 hypothetical protein [Streptomyces sp. A3M-1-3]
MTDAPGPAPAPAPAIGETVRDTHRNRLGIITDHLGPYIQLRPLVGGREWDANPDHIEPVSPPEVLSARLAEVNSRSRRPRPSG